MNRRSFLAGAATAALLPPVSILAKPTVTLPLVTDWYVVSNPTFRAVAANDSEATA